eukprot:754666-Hanusia_phi.AAC.1
MQVVSSCLQTAPVASLLLLLEALELELSQLVDDLSSSIADFGLQGCAREEEEQRKRKGRVGEEEEEEEEAVGSSVGSVVKHCQKMLDDLKRLRGRGEETSKQVKSNRQTIRRGRHIMTARPDEDEQDGEEEGGGRREEGERGGKREEGGGRREKEEGGGRGGEHGQEETGGRGETGREEEEADL